VEITMLAKLCDYLVGLAIAIGLAKAIDYWWFFQ